MQIDLNAVYFQYTACSAVKVDGGGSNTVSELLRYLYELKKKKEKTCLG